MKIIIHDLPETEFERLFPHRDGDLKIIADDGSIQRCTGCFGCWVKTPGACVIRDCYGDMGALLSRAEQVIVISRCCYGGYSPFVKNVLDRSISYLLPFFKTIDGETHHQRRYRQSFEFCVYFYGEAVSPEEMETARSLVKANSVNFFASKYSTVFCETPQELFDEVKIL